MSIRRHRGFAVFSVVGLAVAASPAAHGQSISIFVAEPTLTPGESTLITLAASYPDGDFAVAGIATTLQADAGFDGLGDFALVSPMDGPGTSVGVAMPLPGGDRGEVSGIIAGQLNFPPAGIFADPTRPIAFYSLTYTAPDTITRPLLLDLKTDTSRFDVYVDRDSATSVSRLDGLSEGSARIVIPAPAASAVLAMGMVALARRRR